MTWWYYLLAIVIAVLVLLPPPVDPAIRLKEWFERRRKR